MSVADDNIIERHSRALVTGITATRERNIRALVTVEIGRHGRGSRAGYTPPVPAKGKLRVLAIAAGVLVLGLGAASWAMWPEVDAIPEQLEEISEETSVAELTLEAQGPLPAIRLGDLAGKTVFIMIEGKESMTGGEGRGLHRALYRWQLPDDVVGLSVGDAPAGAVVMRGKIERDFVGPMREEMKLPIYIDYGGDFTTAFSLPKGHFGFVVLDPRGEVLLRHAGDADEAKIAEIAGLLRAQDPPEGPPAPDFELEGLDRERCSIIPCVLVFLDAKVVRADIPGLEEGGFEGEMDEVFEQIKKPSVRLARIMATDWKPEDRERLAGVIVGEGEGWEVEGWPFVAEAPQLREAFGVGDAAGMVIIADGKVAFSETGRIPFWKLALAGDLLGIDAKDYSKKKRDAG